MVSGSMDEQEEKVIRFDCFRQNFQRAFNSLEDHIKVNRSVEFFFDADWNLMARLNEEKLFYARTKGSWIKIR